MQHKENFNWIIDTEWYGYSLHTGVMLVAIKVFCLKLCYCSRFKKAVIKCKGVTAEYMYVSWGSIFGAYTGPF
jgi:hypothetical protein